MCPLTRRTKNAREVIIVIQYGDTVDLLERRRGNTLKDNINDPSAIWCYTILSRYIESMESVYSRRNVLPSVFLHTDKESIPCTLSFVIVRTVHTTVHAIIVSDVLRSLTYMGRTSFYLLAASSSSVSRLFTASTGRT